MRNRTTLKQMSALAAVALIVAACGAQVGTQAPAASGGGATGDKILIGSTLSLTGIQAPLDEPGLRGAKLAVKELNKKGGILGKQVELINLDGKSDPVVVGNVALELIQQGAKAIIAPCDFDFGGPASREAQQAGIVGLRALDEERAGLGVDEGIFDRGGGQVSCRFDVAGEAVFRE